MPMQLPASPPSGDGSSGRAEGAADGDAVHGEPVGRAEVGEEEDADGARALDDARRRADAALPLAADHAGAGADGPLGHRSGRRAEHCRPDVLGRDLGAPGVVEPGVVALADHGDGHHIPTDRRLELGEQLDDRIPGPSHLHRGREQDRRLEHAPLADLDRRGQLARAVEHGHARRPSVADDLADRSGDDGGDARTSDPAPRRRVGLVPPDGAVADEDPRHVGDGVARPGRQQADLDAQVPGPGAQGRCRHRRDCTQPPSRWLLARVGLGRGMEPRQNPMARRRRSRPVASGAAWVSAVRRIRARSRWPGAPDRPVASGAGGSRLCDGSAPDPDGPGRRSRPVASGAGGSRLWDGSAPDPVRPAAPEPPCGFWRG